MGSLSKGVDLRAQNGRQMLRLRPEKCCRCWTHFAEPSTDAGEDPQKAHDDATNLLLPKKMENYFFILYPGPRDSTKLIKLQKDEVYGYFLGYDHLISIDIARL